MAINTDVLAFSATTSAGSIQWTCATALRPCRISTCRHLAVIEQRRRFNGSKVDTLRGRSNAALHFSDGSESTYNRADQRHRLGSFADELGLPSIQDFPAASCSTISPSCPTSANLSDRQCRTFWRYITSGFADRLAGRWRCRAPGRRAGLASLSVSVQATSVLLDLLNGALLFWLLLKLGQTLRRPERQTVSPHCSAQPSGCCIRFCVHHAVYLQRETILPATFTLIGLLAYIASRARIPEANSPA